LCSKIKQGPDPPALVFFVSCIKHLTPCAQQFENPADFFEGTIYGITVVGFFGFCLLGNEYVFVLAIHYFPDRLPLRAVNTSSRDIPAIANITAIVMVRLGKAKLH
jgi:hypothetical protein